MLILDRRESESIVIDGPARITIVRTTDNRVKIGIDADRTVKILRAELLEKNERDAA